MVRKSQGLTEKHVKILEFLANYQTENGRPPSIREIGEKVKISSTSVINYYLSQLEKLGYLERNVTTSRGVILTQRVSTEILFTSSKNLEINILPKVFISYAKEDLLLAKEIYSFLKLNNLSPWLDEFNLLPGQDWDKEIQKAIEVSDYIIICLSNNAVSKRGYIQKEIRKALSILDSIPEGDIYIIPVRLEKCNVPSALLAKQWLDWYEPNAQKRLLKVFDFPNISSRFSKKSNISGFREPQDYVLYTLNDDKSIDEIISNLIFRYDLRPSQAEKIYNECYKKLLITNN